MGKIPWPVFRWRLTILWSLLLLCFLAGQNFALKSREYKYQAILIVNILDHKNRGFAKKIRVKTPCNSYLIPWNRGEYSVLGIKFKTKRKVVEFECHLEKTAYFQKLDILNSTVYYWIIFKDKGEDNGDS